MIRVFTGNRPLKLLLLSGIILFTASVAFTKPLSITGKIAGRVTDTNTGEALPYVNVVIDGTSVGAATDLDGYYSILNIAPGTYNLKVSAIGYSPLRIEGVKVSIDLTSTIDIQLTESSVELSQVVVLAERPLVTKDLTASTSVIGSDEIASLPVTEFQEVLQLQAGVVNGHVRGGRSGEIVYAIDGVPVTDVFDGSTVVDVNANAIEELQFISGAFNAEYGKALSAYVNIATKEGGNDFTGMVTTYFGDYLSSHTNIFRGINQFNPNSIHNYEVNFTGPIYKDLITFYVNGRYNYFGGWMYGKRVFNPWDLTINNGSSLPIEERYSIQATGDGKLVPMNWNEKIYLQGKLTFKPFSTLKINYNYILDNNEYKEYDHTFSYNPDGDYKRFRNGYTNILGITHSLSASTFYQANVSYFYKTYKHYVYEDVNDSRYTHKSLLTQEPDDVPSFRTGGTQAGHMNRSTGTLGFKIDLTSQVTKSHLLKIGAELNQHRLAYNNITLIQDGSLQEPTVSGNPFAKLHIPDINDPNENYSIDYYIRKPVEFSAYLQDKIELVDMIVNIGVRFDYFRPDGQLLVDPSDPDIYRPRKEVNAAKTLEERRSYWYKKPIDKFQLSPRLGIAFPITDRGVLHFSYGHFFQIPNFDYLYRNQEYKFGSGTGNLGIVGNPDLKPEQTINGEVGLQQALTDNITIDLTGYFRDIRNLTGTRADEIRFYGGTESYSQYVNSDFGFVKGVVFSLSKNYSDGWSASIDYTFQIAKGNASDPSAIRNQIASGQRPEVQLIRLSSDQTHTVNATFSYTSEDHWGFSVIGQYGSGFPYTPSQSMDISELLTNSELMPPSYNVDVKLYKDIFVFGWRFDFFARIYNLFDIKNELNVYTDSGTANFTLQEYLQKQKNLPAIVNTIDEYYRNPTYYSEPRRIEFGVSIFLK
jgi:outer membrane receptor protein involved in Fe transport